jgi:phage tail sheath protein FI
VTTSLTAGQTKVARRRLADYVMRLVTAGQEPYEGGPIDPATRSRQRGQVKAALKPLKEAGQKGEAEITEAIANFSVATTSSNTDLQNGIHKIQVRVQSFATQDVILFLLTVGPTVTIEELPVAA